jgi:hypothetical protein
VFEKRVLRRIFGPKRHEVTKGWRELYNEKLHYLYCSPNIIKMTKSRRVKWTGRVARMGRRRMRIGYWWVSKKERDHWEEQDVGGWTILKLFFINYCVFTICT